ncbi:MAG: hypothetical protein LC732_04200 [Acidobacteria bacterium]|nr:hypothetical protein [Acidobacteriota bacterium]
MRQRPPPRQLFGEPAAAAAGSHLRCFGWQGWNQAANWAAQNGVDLDDALAWADRSIGMNRNFTNLRTRALVLAKKVEAS